MSLANVFESVTSLQNPNGSPQQNGNYGKLSWNDKVANAYGSWDHYAVALADMVRQNSASVRNELDQFAAVRKQSPTEHAVRCFVFSLLSPQTNFEENLVACENVMRVYSSLDSVTTVLEALYVPFHGTGNTRLINLGLGKAQSLYHALPYLDALNDDNLATEFTHEKIIAQRGIGDKTASFALALFDEHSEVFTCDTWMLRLTIALHGETPRAVVTPTKKGYATTQNKWIAFCKQYLPEKSIFEVQWCLWNLCFGEHKSHLGIIGG